MTDERIRSVLARAAEDRTFLDALMEDRESALGAFDLSPEEKALLMAPTDEQLGRMVEQTGKRRSLVSPLLKVLGGVTAAGVALSMCIPATTGHSREAVHEVHARSTLIQIAEAEELYRKDHGCYVSLDDLKRAEMIGVSPGVPYEYQVELDGDTFTATARHRTRPDTRPSFQVGPDGNVKRIE